MGPKRITLPRVLPAVAALLLLGCSTPGGRGISPAGLQVDGAAPPAGSQPAAPSDAAPTGGAAPGANPAAPAAGAREQPGIRESEWTLENSTGTILEGPHIRMHSTLRDAAFARSLATFAEFAFDNYHTALAPLPVPVRTLESYVFGTRSQWEAFANERLGKDAATYTAIGKGGFTTDATAILYDIGRPDTYTILAHEGWHQYSQSVLKHQMPVWMEEGVACWMEGLRLNRDGKGATFLPWRNMERFGELRNAAQRDRLISLEKLLDSTPEAFLREGKDRMLLYYAQVWALVHFLNEGEGGRYREGMRQLLADAAAGRLAGRMAASRVFPNPKVRSMQLGGRIGKWVLMEYANPSFAELKRQYDAFVEQVVAPGSGQRIWRGESPLPSAPASGPQGPP
ncbi:MAG: DUF1570 domain-containing protein [Phycisphaerales bacterium]